MLEMKRFLIFVGVTSVFYLVHAQNLQDTQLMSESSLYPNYQVPKLQSPNYPYSIQSKYHKTNPVINSNPTRVIPHREPLKVIKTTNIQTFKPSKMVTIQPLLSGYQFRPSSMKLEEEPKYPNIKPTYLKQSRPQSTPLVKLPTFRGGIVRQPLANRPTHQLQYPSYYVSTDQKQPSFHMNQNLQPPVSEYAPNINFNQEQPVPSQDFQAPSSKEPWNPENDPNLYYTLSTMVIKPKKTTKIYPKKYNPKVNEKPKESTVTTTESEAKKDEETFNKDETKKQAENDKIEEVTVRIKNEPVAEESNGFDQSIDNKKLQSEENNSDNAESEEDGGSDKAAPKERVDFQMHGFDGPLSYKWGFDTGAGQDRQFRYEERDKLGHVKGHYGYYENGGKLRMVHYNANPNEGFIAETENFEKE